MLLMCWLQLGPFSVTVLLLADLYGINVGAFLILGLIRNPVFYAFLIYLFYMTI